MGELVDLDPEHLRLLRIGFFILAVMTGDTRLAGWIFLVVGGVFLLLGVTAARANSVDL